jgi:hypothetical protein
MPRTKDSEHYEIGYAAFLKSSVQLEQNSTERQTLNRARLRQCDSGNVACVVSVKCSVGVHADIWCRSKLQFCVVFEQL